MRGVGKGSPIPADHVGVHVATVRIPNALLEQLGNPLRLRVEVEPETGFLYMSSDPRGVKVCRTGSERSGLIPATAHRTPLGRRFAQVLDGWILEVQNV